MAEHYKVIISIHRTNVGGLHININPIQTTTTLAKRNNSTRQFVIAMNSTFKIERSILEVGRESLTIVAILNLIPSLGSRSKTKF